ncbi:hypothetical protein [Phaeospirillum tilakii]|uniref:Uncharacterized protein n=1 Tax=Phaeospirillum tilakii TaxID=741673 RepID=A0ABW5CGH6_9PROT
MSTRPSDGEKLLSIVGHFLPVPKPNSAMSLVLYVASLDPNIINRDIAFAQYANTRFWNDVGMELKNSAYKIYVANSIKQAAGVISVCAGGGDFVKGFLIKIGCESIMDKIAKNYF